MSLTSQNLIPISKLNDFLYSPKSLYFHSVYDNYDTQVFHSKFQTRGKNTHKTIDKQEYSSTKKYLQGIFVFSEKYHLYGKIDIYDQEKETLIERKYQVKQIFQGYKYQLWGEMLCMQEMNYPIQELVIHSLTDNKKYKINKPTTTELKKFKFNIQKILTYNPTKESQKWKSETIDEQTIYNPLYF